MIYCYIPSVFFFPGHSLGLNPGLQRCEIRSLPLSSLAHVYCPTDEMSETFFLCSGHSSVVRRGELPSARKKNDLASYRRERSGRGASRETRGAGV